MQKIEQLGVHLLDYNQGRVVVMNEVGSSLVFEVKRKQDQNPFLLELKANVHKHKVMDFEQKGDGILMYKFKLYVPEVDELQERIM